MKNCIATFASGKIGLDLLELSGPLMVEYARKCDAELRILGVIDDWRMIDQLNVAGLLDHYDRVAYFDADCLIHPSTPNLFKLVPADRWAAHDECATFSADAVRAAHDYMRDTAVAEGMPVPETHGRFFNFGVQVFGRQHARLYDAPRTECPHPWFPQALVNLRLFWSDMPFVCLPQAFNCSPGLTNDRRFACSNWVIHFAGMGGTQARRALRLVEMRETVKLWRRS